MDKQTFYAELSERLLNVGLSREYIERHIAQFESYFSGKSDSEVSAEISKLGDLNKVAARIKRMTEKSINEAKIENEAKTHNNVNTENADNNEKKIDEQQSSDNDEIINREEDELITESGDIKLTDDDVTVFEKHEQSSDDTDIGADFANDGSHGTKRGIAVFDDKPSSVTVSALDQETIDKNRKKFWIIFAATSPVTAALLAATAAAFALAFFLIAVIILIAVGALVFITAAGTVVSVFGIIFGASQMLNSVPIGLYECGVSVIIAAIAMFVGILVYNFAVRLMPYAAKWLLVFMRYVARKYRELYVYLKKECIGL